MCERWLILYTTTSMHSDVQITEVETADNHKRIIQCTITGLLPGETDFEIRFNDLKRYSCEPWMSSTLPYSDERSKAPYTVSTDDGTSCALHIPISAASSYDGKYYCRIEVHTKDNECMYLESKSLLLTTQNDVKNDDNGESDDPNIASKAVTVLVSVTVTAIVITVVLLVIALISCSIYKNRRMRNRPRNIHRNIHHDLQQQNEDNLPLVAGDHCGRVRTKVIVHDVMLG